MIPCCRETAVAPLQVIEGVESVDVGGDKLKFAAGQTVFREDDAAGHFFEVRRGTVNVFRTMADGRRQILDFLCGGARLGLSGQERYLYSADAATEVIAVRYRRRDLEARIAGNPALVKRLLAEMSDELRAAQDQILLLGRKTAPEKVASFLLMMAKRTTGCGGIVSSIDLPMRRRDIADYLGFTVETVSRVLTRFRRGGLIDLPSPNRVLVLRSGTLRELAEGAEIDANLPRLKPEREPSRRNRKAPPATCSLDLMPKAICGGRTRSSLPDRTAGTQNRSKENA